MTTAAKRDARLALAGPLRGPAGRRRIGWLAGALSGLALLGCTSALPWTEAEFRLDWWVRILMGLCGATLLVPVVSPRRRPHGGVTTAVGLLGLGVLVYPSLLALSAAGIGGAAVAIVASAWHSVPLTLVQLAPVLASGQVTGRSRRGWSAAILVVAVINVGLVGWLMLAPDGAATPLLSSLATLLWIGSFGLAPIATWTAVRGSSGDTRRRAIVAALASLLPVLVIAWCDALSVIGQAAGWSLDGDVLALMLGFSAGTLGGGSLVLAATATSSALLRTRSVVLILNLVVGTTIAIAGSVVAVVASTAQLPVGWAVAAGAAVAAAVGLPWLRLHGWISRVVDPAAELRHELTRLGEVAEGGQRATVLHVLRRLVDDPGLGILYHVAGDAWETTEEDPVVPGVGDLPLAWHQDGRGPESCPGAGTPEPSPCPGSRASVLVRAGSAASSRLLALGDCTALLQPALLEARAGYASRQAGRAAEEERRRLGQNLHDGLQGRLLGLALQLQLSGRGLEDPAARLLVDATVGTLRSLVEDVRALGGGSIPELLVDAGLRPALASLFRPLGPLVELDLPATRYPPEVEATAYFVVGEAVANALKHADAGRIGVRLADEAGHLAITVRDDGQGGADPRLGTGLRGLSERVAARGGMFVVRDDAPGGTVVEAVLPCG